MLWLKAIHVIFVVCWFAGLFYLPRIFVYHAMTKEKAVSDQFKVMEHKLYYYIMWPSMIGAALFGFIMIYSNEAYYSGLMWLHIKLILVLLLVGYHFMYGYYLRLFKQDKNTRPHKFYRLFNEVPTIFLIIIIILSIVKP